MKPGDYRVFLRELISLLPKRAEPDWCELSLSSHPRATVVVVCGFGATHRSVSAIRKRLLKDQFDVVVLAMSMEDLSDGVWGLSHMAVRLHDTVKSLSKRSGPVFVVAHSAGGLVARYFLQNLSGYELCDGLVTLATPHRGTWVAAFGFITHLILKAKVLWEMLPLSGFIRTLNQGAVVEGFPILSIRSKEDLLCPERSTDIPNCWQDAKQVRSMEIPGLSHMDFLMSKDCYLAISQFLKHHLNTLSPNTPDLAVGGQAK